MSDSPKGSQVDGMDPNIMVQYWTKMGVKPETIRTIQDDMEKKKAEIAEERRRQEEQEAKDAAALAAAAAAPPPSSKSGSSAAARANAAKAAAKASAAAAAIAARQAKDVAKFAVNQGVDAAMTNSLLGDDAVMVWGILEGQPAKIEEAYAQLVNFVSCSWELYRAELEAATFPVFVHCYLILANTEHSDQARSLMRAWGGTHEARYRDEVAALKMVTAKEHVGASEYAQLVLRHKFRVRMCLMSSRLLSSYLSDFGLLVIMHILNTRVMLLLEDRPPLPSLQVVRCGPDDAFSTSMQGNLVRARTREAPTEADAGASTSAATLGANSGIARDGKRDSGEVKWAAGPSMEVALLKQSEKDAIAAGLHYPLTLNAKGPTPPLSLKTSLSPSTAMMSSSVAAATGAAAVAGGGGAGGGGSSAPATVANGAAQGEGGSVGVSSGPIVPSSVPTGSAATAERRQRANRLEKASEETENTATQFGGLHQQQVILPRKPPPMPDVSTQWEYLRLSLRPLDSRLLKDALTTPEGGARRFVADPLSPHVVMLTFFNALDTLCCLAPTRDGMQNIAVGEMGVEDDTASQRETLWFSHKTTATYGKVAAGFTDRMVRAWRTAPNAPFPRAADETEQNSPHSAGETVGTGHPAAGRDGPVVKFGKGKAAAGNSIFAGSAGGAAGQGVVGLSGERNESQNGPGGDTQNDGQRRGENDKRLQQPVRFVGHSRPIYGVSWSPDGRFLLSAGGDGEVRLWDLARKGGGNAAGYVRYDGHCGPVWDVAFGPVGYYFATAASDRTACLWSTDCAQPLRIFAGHLKGVLCVAFHPNGNYVVTGSMDKTVRVWDVQTGDCVRLLAGHAGNVTCVSVSPSGRHIAAGSTDHDIRVWDIATGKIVALFKGHTGDVECLDFSAEGSALVSGGQDNNVLIWDVASACSSRRRGASGHPVPNGTETRTPSSDEKSVDKTVKPGTKRKARLWSSTEDDSSVGPLHTFATRNTGVYSVLFTKRNLVIAAGVCHGKA